MCTVWLSRAIGNRLGRNGHSQQRPDSAARTTRPCPADASHSIAITSMFNEHRPRVRPAIEGQSVRLTAGQRRPERRSNDGQPILKPIQMAPGLHSDLGFLVELWGFEPQSSCMPWELRKFNCRQMPARDAPCHSIRNRPRPERRSDDGQNDLETAMDHTNTGREEAAIWQSSASQQAGANACTGGDNPGGTNVVRFAPIAESAWLP